MSPYPCRHDGCLRTAVGIVRISDSDNALGQTHDCCGYRHRCWPKSTYPCSKCGRQGGCGECCCIDRSHYNGGHRPGVTECRLCGHVVEPLRTGVTEIQLAEAAYGVLGQEHRP